VPAKWTLENALPIVRAMNPIVRRCNFSLAFRGSVLIEGESDNDLDLCFLHEHPSCSSERVWHELAHAMPELRFGSLHKSETSRECGVIWLSDDRHIEVQFCR
jgi:hypothetical protein